VSALGSWLVGRVRPNDGVTVMAVRSG